MSRHGESPFTVQHVIALKHVEEEHKQQQQEQETKTSTPIPHDDLSIPFLPISSPPYDASNPICTYLSSHHRLPSHDMNMSLEHMCYELNSLISTCLYGHTTSRVLYVV